MNAENSQERTPQSGVGYLVVAVSTARGAIPLEGASVNVRASGDADSTLHYALLTDRDGKTEKLRLPAPPRSLSQSPSNGVSPQPFAFYHVDVSKEGYFRQIYENVAVFDGITSIQPAIMIPLPETVRNDSYAPGNEITYMGEEPSL